MAAETMYLVLPDKATADALSHAKAIQMGAGGQDDVTQFWWRQIVQQDKLPTVALEIGPPDSQFDISSLSPEYLPQLVDAATMVSNGWVVDG